MAKSAAVVAMICAVIAVCPGVASATKARVAALGGGADYFDDDRNVLRWYADLGTGDNVALLDLGQYDLRDGEDLTESRLSGQSGGVITRLDEKERWGSFGAFFFSDANTAAPGEGFSNYRGGCISLLYARLFGPVRVGTGFRGTSYSDGQNRNGEPLTIRDDFRHDWGLGLQADVSRSVSVDLAGEVRWIISRLVDADRNLWETGSWSKDSFAVRARTHIAVSDGITLTSLADYVRDSHMGYSNELADMAVIDGWLLRLGLSLRSEPRPGRSYMLTVEYGDGSDDHTGLRSLYADYWSQTRRWHSIGVRAAAEIELRPWLVARCAVRYERMADEADRLWPAENLDYWYRYRAVGVAVPLSVGCTARWRDLEIDMAYNDGGSPHLTDVSGDGRPAEESRFATVSLRFLF